MQHTPFSVILINFLSGFTGLTAYAAILGVLLICGLGVPIPEDITLISAGILAALKNISLVGALIVCFVGVLLGDCILFFLGRKYGYRVFKLPLVRRVFKEKQINMARQRVINNSQLICFTARFLPGLRAPIYLTAGIMGVKPHIFILLDGFAALISVPVWVLLGWYVGDNLDYALGIAFKLQKYIFAILAIIVITYISWRVYVYKRVAKESKESVSVSPSVPELKE